MKVRNKNQAESDVKRGKKDSRFNTAQRINEAIACEIQLLAKKKNENPPEACCLGVLRMANPVPHGIRTVTSNRRGMWKKRSLNHMVENEMVRNGQGAITANKFQSNVETKNERSKMELYTERD